MPAVVSVHTLPYGSADTMISWTCIIKRHLYSDGEFGDKGVKFACCRIELIKHVQLRLCDSDTGKETFLLQDTFTYRLCE